MISFRDTSTFAIGARSLTRTSVTGTHVVGGAGLLAELTLLSGLRGGRGMTELAKKAPRPPCGARTPFRGLSPP
ncbi:hypothetical protein GCM10010493_04750 [Streptomyces lavendulae subsp. grasserius]